MIENLGSNGELLEFIYDSETLELHRLFNGMDVRVENEVAELIPRWRKLFKEGITNIKNNIYLVALNGALAVLVNDVLYKITTKAGNVISNYVSRPYIEDKKLKCIHSLILTSLYYTKATKMTPEQLKRMYLFNKDELESIITNSDGTEKSMFSVKLRG